MMKRSSTLMDLTGTDEHQNLHNDEEVGNFDGLDVVGSS
jgi:hypothetical protein